jgi:hypothetical protein
MQIVENGPLGLRSAVLRLQSRNAACTYLLFPMVHVGEPAFYDAVAVRASECDHILVEGVRHKMVGVASRMYDKVAASPRMRLTVQRVMTPALRPVKDRIVNIDMPPDQFQALWQRQPLWTRLFLPSLFRLVFWHFSKFGTRKQLAPRMHRELAPSRHEIFGMGDELEFTKLIVNRRDEHIVAKLDEFHEAHRNDPVTVAIIFGAGHMRAIVRHLIDRHGYVAAAGSWLTIFGWNLPPVAPVIPPHPKPVA